ncbi:MAG: DNA gyrase subunit A [bacterium]|nr:DNA gyrase subunit A [bacterium]
MMDQPRIVPMDIGDELKKSMLDYSMSTLVNRALPDVRDGLKPSQRRILVAMNDLGLTPNRQHRKCANIAGHTSGNYHPHGEAIVYPTLVHLAQDFKMRYPLVNGQGNFGSIDGYPPAAMRYTEARMAGPGGELLADLEKDTVDFRPNYDERLQEPIVLPARFPNLLCNGAVGIAVSMATAIPPHNLTEVVDGLAALIDNPDLDISDLMEYIKAPDFPTGGIIYGMSGVLDAYRTGRGLIKMRAQATIEEVKNDRENIIITEIPYMVVKQNLLEKMADLVRDKKIDGISNIRDESDRDGMRIVIELKRDAYSDVVLNQLYKHTQLESTFGANMIALVNGRPKQMALKEMLEHYIDHRHEVLVRRTRFELGVAEDRAHILEGLKIALDAIDLVIEIIRGSADPEAARQGLMDRLELSERQAQAILAMTLQRLTSMEQQKIENEYADLIREIERLKSILESRDQRMEIIKTDLQEIKKKYGDERRTEVVFSASEFNIEDLIAEEDMVITITHAGYIKRLPVSTYRAQGRGGRGISGIRTKEEDFAEHLFVASTHSYILFLTDRGHCYWLKVYEIPEGGRVSRGRPIINLIEVDSEDKIAAIVPVREFDDEHHLIQVTRKGQVKKTVLSAYGRPRRNGIIAMTIQDNDTLIEAAVTDGSQEIVLATRNGQAIRFKETDVRNMGRSAQGVKGVRLGKDDEVVGMVVVREDSSLLTVCSGGYGKRTLVDDYRLTRRGGKGVINIKTSERNGDVVAVKGVVDDDELMIISFQGILIRQSIKNISMIGRNTQGVRLINLDEGDRVIDVARMANQHDEEVDEMDGEATDGSLPDVEGERADEPLEGEAGSNGEVSSD